MSEDPILRQKIMGGNVSGCVLCNYRTTDIATQGMATRVWRCGVCIRSVISPDISPALHVTCYAYLRV